MALSPSRQRRLSRIPAEQIPRIDLLGHISQVVGHAVGDDHVGLLFELRQVIHLPGVVELGFLEHRLIDDHLDALNRLS